MTTYCVFGDRDNIQPLLDALDAEATIYLCNHAADAGVDGNIITVQHPFEILATVDVVIDLGYSDDFIFFGEEEGQVRADSLVVVNALHKTATHAAELLCDGQPVVAISWIPSLFASSGIIEASLALQIADADRASVVATLSSHFPNRPIEIVEDRLGLVSARTLAMVINEAAFAVMEGVASAEDIDTAMKLGTNYPEGPLRWADIIGPSTVVELLDGLFDEYREERYRTCVLLRQMARAGKTFRSL